MTTSQSKKNKLRFACQGLLGSLIKDYRRKDEWGNCANCGNLTRFSYRQMLDEHSPIVVSCNWDSEFTEIINITNTLNCYHCKSIFRIRCIAKSLLKFCWQEKFFSISELSEYLRNTDSNWLALETASTGGLFSDYKDLKNIIKSEYFDDIENGAMVNGVYSEDLQSLTLKDQTLDALISADVFEHIADPWKAFSEVERVLKSEGIGFITVPIDIRNHNTQTLATIENNDIQYFKKPSYHLDPLREEGALVFTEFGTDIVEKLRLKGYNAAFDTYKTKRTNVSQFVIIIRKRVGVFPPSAIHDFGE